MKVIPIFPRGYCPGVIRAIKIVEQVVADPSYPRPIHLLGMIVHNQFVVDHFKKEGVLCLEDDGKTRLQLLDRIREGTVVITAHGAGDDVIDKIMEKGLAYVDATCKDVYKTHNLIKNHLADGFEILYVGKARHPETEGVLALNSGIRLLETPGDVDRLPEGLHPVFLTNQTTFSIRDIETILQAVRRKYPEAVIAQEICASTRTRQEAVIAANIGVDLCVVVGDPHSNNTESLAKISERVTGVRTVRIASVADLTPEMLQGVQTVTVTSGASTPPEITDAVIRRLESQ